jgi:hypothetical protein
MSKDTSRWDSPQSSATWKKMVTDARGEYSVRLKSARLINAKEFLSWPTTTARDYKGTSPNYSTRKDGKSRADQLAVAVDQWPTPTAMEAGKIGNQPNFGQVGLSNHPAIVGQPSRDKLEKGGKSGQAVLDNHNTDGNHQESWSTQRAGATDNSRPNNKGGIPLNDQAKREQWRTPAACDGEGGVRTAEDVKDDPQPKLRLRDTVNHEISSTSKMKLNARWVETLMGLPVGWTMPSCANPVTIELMSCDCSETESYPRPVKKPSEH